MKFFTDPTPFTHYGRFYNFPVYFADLGEEGPTIAGTNVIWDWCVAHVAPQIQFIVETIRYIRDGDDYEPGGFQMEVLGTLEK